MAEQITRGDAGVAGWISAELQRKRHPANRGLRASRSGVASTVPGTAGNIPLLMLAAGDGPIVSGAVAVVVAFALRGPGGGMSRAGAAQGTLCTETRPQQQDRATQPPSNDPSMKGHA